MSSPANSGDTPFTITIKQKDDRPLSLSSQNKAAPIKSQISVVAYMLASSTMLIINKVAVHLFPIPTVLLVIQLLVSSAIIYALGTVKILEVDRLDLPKIKAYIGVVLVFLCNIFTNIKALQYSNVETVIVFRTCTTLAIAYGDYKFLRRGNPTSNVVVSLLLIILGCTVYVFTDSSIHVESYFWTLLYFLCQCTDVLYIKYITNNVAMTSWGRSFYNNFLALPFIVGVAVITGELSQFGEYMAEGHFEWSAYFVVGISCVMGLMISYTGFLCREAVSATSFSVVGNMNKVLTVAINLMIWDKHASAGGIVGLLISLVGGALYTKFTQ